MTGCRRQTTFQPQLLWNVLVGLGLALALGCTYSVLAGYKFLDFTPLKPSDLGVAESWGMTLVEYGVGITVAAVMITVFSEITEGTLPVENSSLVPQNKRGSDRMD